MPFGCVICGDGWVVLWYCLKLATKCVGLGPLGRGSDVGQAQLLLVPCPGPLGMSYKVICRWLPLVLAWRSLGEAKLQTEPDSRYCQASGCLARSMLHTEARHCLSGICKHLRDFRNVLNVSPRQIICIEKPLKKSWGGLQVG